MLKYHICVLLVRLKFFASFWKELTSDKFILDCVSHCHIEFYNNTPPNQASAPRVINFSLPESVLLTKEIEKLISKGVLEEIQFSDAAYISTIFLREKKDKTYRMVLNLKEFNKSVQYHHFKMESLLSAIRLMRKTLLDGFY